MAMADNTDDIAEEISFQSFDDDCRLLGSLLNDVLQREVGNPFMEKLEKIRVLAQVFLCLHTHSLGFSFEYSRLLCDFNVGLLVKSFVFVSMGFLSLSCHHYFLGIPLFGC